MAINLECPRCKAHLFVPNKLAGGYVNCPHCKGRFWVDKAAPADATPTESVTLAVPPAIIPPTPSSSVETGVPPRTSAPSATPRDAILPTALPGSPFIPLPSSSLPLSSPSSPIAPPILPPSKKKTVAPVVPSPPPVISPALPDASSPPRPGRKVARFITAEAAQSTLQLAADGKLPELHLQDGNRKEEQEKKSSTLSPLALFAIVFLSVAMSIMVAMIGGETSSNNTEQRKAAWEQIEANYFSDPGGKELKEYNLMLREAKQAHQSQDYKTERELFRRLLERLRTERDVRDKGLTGSRDRDKKLEEYITTLMSGTP